MQQQALRRILKELLTCQSLANVLFSVINCQPCMAHDALALAFKKGQEPPALSRRKVLRCAGIDFHSGRVLYLLVPRMAAF